MKVFERFGAVTGAVYVVLVIAGNSLSTDSSPGPHPNHPTGQQDIASLHWLAGSTLAQVGVTLELLGFAAWMLFVGYLSTRVRAGGWLASAALIGGVVSIAVKLGSRPGALLAVSVDERSGGSALSWSTPSSLRGRWRSLTCADPQ